MIQDRQGINLTVALTGASGAIFGQQLLSTLDADERVTRVNFIASENSLRVLAEELQLSGRNSLVEKLLGHPSEKIRQLSESDIGAGIASGSYPSNGMIVLPCSVLPALSAFSSITTPLLICVWPR